MEAESLQWYYIRRSNILTLVQIVMNSYSDSQYPYMFATNASEKIVLDIRDLRAVSKDGSGQANRFVLGSISETLL